MNLAWVCVSLDDHPPVYRPGEVLSGCYILDAARGREIRAVELSVLWYTEGKADEDLAVHFFERFDLTAVLNPELGQPRKFATRLPKCPLSYPGKIVKIHWCARLRVFLPRGKEVVVERPFQLGAAREPNLLSDEPQSTASD